MTMVHGTDHRLECLLASKMLAHGYSIGLARLPCQRFAASLVGGVQNVARADLEGVAVLLGFFGSVGGTHLVSKEDAVGQQT